MHDDGKNEGPHAQGAQRNGKLGSISCPVSARLQRRKTRIFGKPGYLKV